MVVVGSEVVGVLLGSTVSVTGFSEEDLVSLGVQDIADVSQVTPNLEIRTFGSTTPTFFIRGVGLNDFTANAAGAIAIYQDEIAMNLPAIQMGQLFDTQKVEVLRGPQGGGSGRNASGGAIRVLSKVPDGDHDAVLRVSYGRFNAVDVEGALEVPIVNSLSSRFAFRLGERDGIVRNGCGHLPPIGLERVTTPGRSIQSGLCGETGFIPVLIDNPNPPPAQYRVSPLLPGLERKLNNQSSWAARGLLRWVNDNENADILVNVHGGRTDQLATVGQAIGTAGSQGGQPGFFGGTSNGYRAHEISDEELEIRSALIASGLSPTQAIEQAKPILAKRLARDLDQSPFRGDYNNPGRERQETFGGFLRAEVDLDQFTLLSISGAERYNRYRRIDSDYTPNVIFENEIEDDAWQFTQELRFLGETEESAVEWEAGAFVIVESLDFQSDIAAGSRLIALTRQYEQETFGLGTYGDVNWSIFDDFTLESGIRLNFERKTFDVNLIRGDNPVLGAICDTRSTPDGRTLIGVDCTDAESWLAPTGTVSLGYAFTEDVSGYLKFSRGWKSGQYNAGGASGNSFTLADPEIVDAFELGMKATLFDGLLNISGALFLYQYQDYQVFLSQNDFSSPPQTIVLNASDAQIYGAELEVDSHPIEGLSLNLRFGWLESEFLDFTQLSFRSISSGSITDPPVIVPIIIDFTDNRLPNTPRFKASGSIDYEIKLGRFGSLIPRYDFSWTDDVFFDPSDGRGSPNLNGQLFMPDFAIGQKGYVLHNARLTYALPDGVTSLSLWVRNLTDETFKTLAFDASASADLVGNLVGDPRTYGAAVEFKW